MRILITGSKGIIGRKLKKELSKKGHSVFGTDLLHHPGEIGFAQEMSSEPWTYARCDIGDFRQLERIFKEVDPFDLVYNTAAEFGRWNGEDYYEQLWKSNLIGVKNLIRLQENLHFKLVHFSSSEVYGDYKGIMKEDVLDKYPIKQLNDYAISKWANEMQIRNSRLAHNTETVIIRLFNTYGPGEFYHPYRSVNAKFCYHALKQLPITVYKGHRRTSTYVDDSVRTIANIADNFIPGRVYNIGGDKLHDIVTLAEIAWEYAKAPKELIKFRESERLTTKDKIVDISLAVKELDHKITVPLEEGIHRTIDWMKEYYKL